MHFKDIVNDKDIKKIECNNLLSQEQINKFEYDYSMVFKKKFTKELKFKYNSLYDLNKIQKQLYRDIFGKDFIDSSERTRIEGKQIYLFKIDENTLNKYKSLYDTKINKIEERKEYYNEITKELDKGIFID